MDTVELQQLVSSLKDRNNKAYQFFENIYNDLKNHATRREALNKLASCFSITQYADFSYDEEQLLYEILNDLP